MRNSELFTEKLKELGFEVIDYKSAILCRKQIDKNIRADIFICEDGSPVMQIIKGHDVIAVYKEEFYDFVTCLGSALTIMKNSNEKEETSDEVGATE